MSLFGARIEKHIVPDATRKYVQLRVGNISGEILGAAGDGHVCIRRTCRNVDWNRDFLKTFLAKRRSQGRSHGKDRTYAWVTIGFTGLLLKLRMVREQLLEIFDQGGKLRRTLADGVGVRRTAKSHERLCVGDAAGDFDHRIAAQRKASRTDATRIDARAKLSVT